MIGKWVEYNPMKPKIFKEDARWAVIHTFRHIPNIVRFMTFNDALYYALRLAVSQ